jgi:hypothetical protein
MLQPAGKCGRVGKRRQPRPSRQERLLDDVLGQLEVVHQGERRAVSGMLKAAGQVDEGRDIALAGAADELVRVHCVLPFTSRCQDPGLAFMRHETGATLI